MKANRHGNRSPAQVLAAIGRDPKTGNGLGLDLEAVSEALLMAATSIRNGEPVDMLLRTYIADALAAAANDGLDPERRVKQFGQKLGLIVPHRKQVARKQTVGEHVLGLQSKGRTSGADNAFAIRKAASHFGISTRTVRNYVGEYLEWLDPYPNEPDTEEPEIE
jgi:hypothetical protein